ncbi:MAG TPA: head maturation protease, ClpP-related [Clostridium sp.]
MKNKKIYEFKALANNEGELNIYGEICSTESMFSDGTEVTPTGFKSELDALGDISVLNVYINSPGGDVFAGQAIYSMLKRNKATINVHIDGLAASIASVVAMAGDNIIMPSNSMMMIHNAWCCAQGSSKDFRKMADDLDKIGLSLQQSYLSKATNMKSEDLVALLDAETWLTAQECLDLGLCDSIDDEKSVAASISDSETLKQYKNTPKELITKVQNKIEPKVNAEIEEQYKLLKQKLQIELQL